MKRTFLMLMMMGLTLSAFSQQITRIAVIDFDRVFDSYFKENQQQREINKLQVELETVRKDLNLKINDLTLKKIEAEEKKDAVNAEKLSLEIESVKKNLQDRVGLYQMKIKNLKEQLYNTSGIAQKVMEKIQIIAETEGFSAVFRANDPYLIWYSVTVDITDKVIEALGNK